MNTQGNFEVIDITPNIAGEFLKRNKTNRPLSQNWSRLLRDRIVAGEWRYNGETIKFDSVGNLIDGQHRLTAVIMANMPIKSGIIKELPSDVFSTLDDGRKRGHADVLAIRGEKNCALLAAVLKMLFNYKERGTPKQTFGKSISNNEIIGIIEEFPGVRESVKFANTLTKTFKAMRPSVAGFCHYLFYQVSPEDTEKFFKGLGDGANLEKNSPVLQLRDRLIYDSVSSVHSYDATHWAHLTIKAWNFYRKGKTVKALNIVYSKDEKFPNPV